MQNLTIPQTIQKIEQLIEDDQGDIGRLHYIVELLKNKKSLYHSDQKYLESKLDSNISPTRTLKNKLSQTTLEKIQYLINSGMGDSGRLQYIYDTVFHGKTLYHSDQLYLKRKLEENNVSEHVDFKPETQNLINTEYKLENISTHENLSNGQSRVTSSKNNVSIQLLQEKAKLNDQIKISNDLEIQKSKLTQIILKRQEFEQKITHEKSVLESQINEERNKIEAQTKLSDEIISQKEELKKVKSIRTSILKTIEQEKSEITKDLTQQKKLLSQAQSEQEKIEKELETEKTNLAVMVEQQQTRLTGQAQMARQIKLMQIELDNTKKQYDEIANEVTQEKAKLSKVEKLKKSIETQEKNLHKIKDERLGLLTSITKEKEKIIKKTQKEKEKIKEQTKLQKLLKKKEDEFVELKKQREKLDAEIKLKQNKIKQKQTEIKNEISKKKKKNTIKDKL